MSSNLQTKRLSKIPLSAKFGLHYGCLGVLPTLEELGHIKSFIKDFGYQLLSLDISSLLGEASKQQNAILEIKVPTLGFTDPAFDYEASPWFAVPLVINGFVATSAHSLSSIADLYATDIVNNQYALKFDAKGHVDYPAIIAEQSAPVFSTLKSIQYCYTIKTLSANKQLQLLADNKYQDKILLLLPKNYAEFQIECTLLSEQKKIMVKNYAIAPPQVKDTIMQVDTQWRGDASYGSLQINYQHQARLLKTNAFEAELSISLPQANHLQYLVYGAKDWLNTHQDKIPCLTQYYGLSASTLLAILHVLVPYDDFCQNISSSDFSQKFEHCHKVNAYSLDSNATGVFYQHLLSGVINHSVPLYALKSYVETERHTFDALKSLDMRKWSVHDQVVYQQILASIEQVMPSVDIVWDTFDSYFSFGLGEISGKLLLETQGAKLAKSPKVAVTLRLDNTHPLYPVPTDVVSEKHRHLHLVDVNKNKQSDRSQSPKGSK